MSIIEGSLEDPWKHKKVSLCIFKKKNDQGLSEPKLWWTKTTSATSITTLKITQP